MKTPCLIHHNAQAAVDYLGNLCGQHFLILKSLVEVVWFPLSASIRLVGEKHLSLAVVYLDNHGLHGVAGHEPWSVRSALESLVYSLRVIMPSDL